MTDTESQFEYHFEYHGGWGMPQRPSGEIPDQYRAAVDMLLRNIDRALLQLPPISSAPACVAEPLAALSRTDPMPEGIVERVQDAVELTLLEESLSASPDEPLA